MAGRPRGICGKRKKKGRGKDLGIIEDDLLLGLQGRTETSAQKGSELG